MNIGLAVVAGVFAVAFWVVLEFSFRERVRGRVRDEGAVIARTDLERQLGRAADALEVERAHSVALADRVIGLEALVKGVEGQIVSMRADQAAVAADVSSRHAAAIMVLIDGHAQERRDLLATITALGSRPVPQATWGPGLQVERDGLDRADLAFAGDRLSALPVLDREFAMVPPINDEDV